MKYYLGDACQNTFVLFDCLESSHLEEDFLKKVHERLIKEDKDDALILYDGKASNEEYYAKMAVLGHDGIMAEFCGNGARVCAAYLFAHFPDKKISLVTPHGIHALGKEGDLYSLKLPSPNFELNSKFIADPGLFHSLGFIYVDMLEPHLIIEKELSDEELFSLGRELNQLKEIFPHGINVNAWHVLKEGYLFVKTYERGVQRLTKSCGTGSISCAAFYKTGTVHISTPGGALKVEQQDGPTLIGPAAFFHGIQEKEQADQ